MSKKPGLFSRLKNSITSTLNDAVDAVTDPGQEVALMLDDLGDQIKKSEVELRQAIVAQKMLERKLETIGQDGESWQKRAEQALRVSDETLARAALERKSELGQEKLAAERALIDQRKVVEDMRQGIQEAKTKLKNLNLRRGSLMSQARAAKQVERGAIGGVINDGGVGSRIDEIEDKIAHIEALNEVNSADLNSRAADAELEAKFSRLDDKSSDVDDELAQLKAKLQANKAISSGKTN